MERRRWVQQKNRVHPCWALAPTAQMCLPALGGVCCVAGWWGGGGGAGHSGWGPLGKTGRLRWAQQLAAHTSTGGCCAEADKKGAMHPTARLNPETALAPPPARPCGVPNRYGTRICGLKRPLCSSVSVPLCDRHTPTECTVAFRGACFFFFAAPDLCSRAVGASGKPRFRNKRAAHVCIKKKPERCTNKHARHTYSTRAKNPLRMRFSEEEGSQISRKPDPRDIEQCCRPRSRLCTARGAGGVRDVLPTTL